MAKQISKSYKVFEGELFGHFVEMNVGETVDVRCRECEFGRLQHAHDASHEARVALAFYFAGQLSNERCEFGNRMI